MGAEQQAAFSKSKALLSSDRLLVHYDPDLPLVLACDASPVGVGAVLSQRMPEGGERPIAFASRTLSTAERKYAQIEREGLAVVFGVHKFHEFLFGREFTLISDHKPLRSLFNEASGVPATASARIQRWALKLSGYNYTFQFKPGATE